MKMKKSLIRIILVIVFAIFFESDFLEAQKYLKSPKVLSENYLDTIIGNIMLTENIPGVSACAIKNGELIWIGHYGYANIS